MKSTALKGEQKHLLCLEYVTIDLYFSADKRKLVAINLLIDAEKLKSIPLYHSSEYKFTFFNLTYGRQSICILS